MREVLNRQKSGLAGIHFITNFDLRQAAVGINLQLLEHLKHSPGNQPW